MATPTAERPAAFVDDGDIDGRVRFTLDGTEVTARPGETIWEVARRLGTTIPHLCHRPEPGYRPDGNCRACMVEIEGERVLAPSCRRAPSEGMVVQVDSPRAAQSRRMVLELLVADQPDRAASRDPASTFWTMAEATGATTSRFPADAPRPAPDTSHIAMQVALDACISCNLCVRACREVQVNDVFGMGGRGILALPILDFNDPMGQSTCVACGECVQACPTGALLPASLVIDGQAQRAGLTETHSICPFCGVGCQVKLLSKDNKVVAVEGVNGPSNEGRLCVKGRFGYDYIHHAHRLTKPLIRRAGAPKEMGLDPANPLSHFREASWEEALAAAADGLKQLRADHGGTAVAGFGSAKCSNEEAYLFQKLIRQGFRHNNVDHCTRLCHASSVAALMENVGSAAVTATFNEIENADVAIIIGANPVENHPVAATYFKQFAKRGGTLIVMDPRGQALKRHATHMLQFKPAGDVSMLNAIMHVIVEEDLADRQYIAAMTENWDAMRAHLAAYTPEAMAPICGIAPETLRSVARAFARGRAGMIFWGMGVSQHVHGTDNSRCLISLALMCGHVGRPGTGLHPLRGQNNVQGASDAGLIPMFLPNYRSVEDAEFRRFTREAWRAHVEAEGPEDPESVEGAEYEGRAGLTVTEILDAIHDGLVKGMVIQGENPAMSDPDLNHARQALAKLQHLVVADIFLTETAMFADVILPAAAFYEKLGTVTNTNRQVQIGQPAVPPPGEARADWVITRDLGRAIGLDWRYEHPREIFAEMASVMPSLDNITWDRLEVERSVTYPSLSPTDPGQAVVFSDSFPREGGRARFAPAAIVPPDELPDADYPMVLTTGRQLEHWHTGSMTRRTLVLDTVEPQANCSLHPATLRRIGVEPGGRVRLETRRGAIELMARADRGVAEDMVFVPFAFVEAAANLLTNPALDPYGKIPEFKYAAVRVSAAG